MRHPETRYTEPGCPLPIRGLFGVHYLSNGDLQLKFRFMCVHKSKYGVYLSTSTTFDFFNRAWGLTNEESSAPSYDLSLNHALEQRELSASLFCFLRCSRSTKATISSSAAKALGLSSSTLAKAHSGPGATLKDRVVAARNGVTLHLKLSRKVRRALKRTSRITVTFHMKAVGPDGQVWKKTIKRTLKKDEHTSDAIG
jgi:hypothetical protein